VTIVAAHGGADPQKLADAPKMRLSRLRTFGRAVPLDFEDVALATGEIAKALRLGLDGTCKKQFFLTVARKTGD